MANPTWDIESKMKGFAYQLFDLRSFSRSSGFPDGSVVKNPSANAGDMGSILGWGTFLGEGNGNSLHFSCLGNPMNRGAWRAIVYGVTKSWTGLSDQTATTGSSTVWNAIYRMNLFLSAIRVKKIKWYSIHKVLSPKKDTGYNLQIIFHVFLDLSWV